MDKQQVLDKLTSFYEEEMKDNIFYQQSKDNQDLVLKLMQTTNLFVRSFDYDLPVGHSLKSKINMFVHRVIRRCTRFITKPYADKMQAYNESVCELLGQMINHFGEKNTVILHETETLRQEFNSYREQQSNVIDGIKDVLNDTINKTLELGGQLTILSQGKIYEEDAEWRSYSQAGEDRIVSFLLNYGGRNEKAISYLDIGCNHYKNLNNSYSFYRQGYRGILVEANPNFIDELREKRPGDIVLNVGIGAVESENAIFYIVNNVDLSSFDKSSIENAMKESPWLEIVEEVSVPIVPINKIIEKYCNGTPTVVSLDVEGVEMDILTTLDFDKYRPRVFVIETICYAATIQINSKRKDIIEFMESKGYAEYAFTGVNSIFVDISQ